MGTFITLGGQKKVPYWRCWESNPRWAASALNHPTTPPPNTLECFPLRKVIPCKNSQHTPVIPVLGGRGRGITVSLRPSLLHTQLWASHDCTVRMPQKGRMERFLLKVSSVWRWGWSSGTPGLSELIRLHLWPLFFAGHLEWVASLPS